MPASSSLRNVEQILRSAQQMMDFARIGQEDFLAGGDRRLLGLYNAITSGRSITFVLQTLNRRIPIRMVRFCLSTYDVPALSMSGLPLIFRRSIPVQPAGLQRRARIPTGAGAIASGD